MWSPGLNRKKPIWFLLNFCYNQNIENNKQIHVTLFYSNVLLNISRKWLLLRNNSQEALTQNVLRNVRMYVYLQLIYFQRLIF